MGRKSPFNYLYPFLFAAYPILALRQANIEYVNSSVILRSIGLTLVSTAILWVILRIVTKDWHKAGILTASGMLLLFSYGHAYLWFAENSSGPIRHSTLASIFLLFFILLSILVIKQKSQLGLVSFLNITSIVLIGLMLVQSGIYTFRTNRSAALLEANRSQNMISTEDETYPDIYLIILDAYPRSDVLRDEYQYDNSRFTSSLEEMGFYIADCSQSNYPGTNLSIISLMNMDYYYNLYDEVQVLPSLRSSAVIQFLKQSGYTVVAFENRASGHFDLFEDIHLSRGTVVFENIDFGGGINEFESMLIETSAFRVFVDMPQLLPGFLKGEIKDSEFYEHYLQTNFILDELQNLPAIPGPKFVFAHILTPHDPFIFKSDGSYEPSGALGPVVGFRNNVSFIDNILPITVKSIIEKSKTPPIIIIQGDHGASDKSNTPAARMSILNAYYMNSEHLGQLYPTITPVNSFRVVFNAYMDTQYPLREDHSYYIWERAQMLGQKNEIANHCQSE